MHTLTDHSRTTHGVLSEPSHREGKGREGKWNGKGGRVETSHHSVALVTRASAAGVVAGPVDEMMTGLSIIEGIDLDAEIPCEDEDHRPKRPAHAADLLARFSCPACSHTSLGGYCWDSWREGESWGWACLACGADGDSLADVMAIVEVLR